MNTISSVYYGWGFLIVAGAGSYYFAKRSINADRAARQAMENESRIWRNRQIAARTHPLTDSRNPSDTVNLTSGGASQVKQTKASQTEPRLGSKSDFDPSNGTSMETSASTTFPEEGKESRFESKKPFRSKKGDRFS